MEVKVPLRITLFYFNIYGMISVSILYNVLIVYGNLHQFFHVMAFPSTNVLDFYAKQLLTILTLLKIHQNLEVAILESDNYFNIERFCKPSIPSLPKPADYKSLHL